LHDFFSESASVLFAIVMQINYYYYYYYYYYYLCSCHSNGQIAQVL